jgi:hypothetical protein
METKEQLIKCVKDWVRIDNEIRLLQKELSTRKNDKKNISKDLMEVMKKNDIDCFDLKDGQLMYTKKNVKKPITKKNLVGILSNFYKGDVEKATELNDFIMENREEVVKENIVRKVFKPDF